MITQMCLLPENGDAGIFHDLSCGRDIRTILEGDLASVLTDAAGGQTKTPARFRTGVRDALASQFEMVAGAGFEPAAFRL